MKKSSRHSKITGDFAEALVLYWLSKSGYECACVDHTGIDLLAFSKVRSERRGISVKCRSRSEGTERASVNLPFDGFEKAREACRTFECEPYYAIVIDDEKVIRCFLLPLNHLEKIVTGSNERMQYWQMGAESLKSYYADEKIEWFELQIRAG